MSSETKLGEFLICGAVELIIKDPIHSYVGIDRDREPVLMSILGSYEVQRLRRLNQLGLAFLAYPGAEHSRFGHSLGVMHVARKILDQLYLNRDLRAAEYRENRELLSVAALLHDIGHGPFSHTFEEITKVSHAGLSIRMVLGDTEVHSLLDAKDTSLPERVTSLMDDSHPQRYLSNLISSQLDADRLDYVLRDATMCGVKYGIFDLDRIIHTIRLRDGNILISAKGQGAVEEYLLARYFMYWHVYFHKTILSVSNIFLNALRRARDLFRRDKIDFLLPALQKLFESLEAGELDLGAYVQLDDSDIRLHMKQWMAEKDEILRDLAARFIKRRPFKMKILYSNNEASAVENRIISALDDKGLLPQYYFTRESPKKSLYNYYTPEEEEIEQNIYIEMPDGQVREISSSPDSTIKHLLNPAPERIFLFYPGEIAEDLKL